MILVGLFAIAATRLEDLDLHLWQQGFGQPHVDQSVLGQPLVVAGERFEHGLGSHAPGGARYALNGSATSIDGSVGVAESGTGSVICSIWGDGKRLWTSPVIRRNSRAVPFSVPLTGVRELSLHMADAFDGNGGDHAVWLNVKITHSGADPTPLPYMRTAIIHPERTRQTIDNFAASDSWTVEPLMRWPESQRKEIARLLFDQRTGIGLSGWRHNLGGGINHETITMPFRTADTYDAGEGKYDFTRNPGQRWMLAAAKAHGVEQIVAYAITPPRRMTKNGFTNGTDGIGTTNLKDGEEAAYARYLAGIVAHFREQGYPITHLSPINEPDYEWNGVPDPGSQEGNRASNADLLRINQAIAQELKQRKLPVQLLTPEASSPQIGYKVNDGMGKKYGVPYGGYAKLFADESAWRQAVAPIYAYHSYWSDGLGEMHQIRTQLREALDAVPGLRPWMTEYCQLAGPRNEGGWGRDLGMTYALNVARLIYMDLTVVEASAWQYWLAVSDEDYKDGLVYVDDIDKPSGEIFASKALWALGNYSRFIRPGFQRVEVEGAFQDVAGVLISAYRDPKTGRVVAVLVNTETSSDQIILSLPGRWSASAFITSDRKGHDLARTKRPTLGKPFRVPSRSVVTVVLDPQQRSE